MNLSKRGEYALRVLVDLAIAKSLGRNLVPLAIMAEAQRIPPAFLEQILLSLRQAGFLMSTRGKHGGYSLSREASEIRLGELVRFLEGPLVTAGCVSAAVGQRCSCPDPKHCGLKLLLSEVQEVLAGVLDGTTLADLATQTLKGFEADNAKPAVMELLQEAAEAGGKASGPRKRGAAEPEYLI